MAKRSSKVGKVVYCILLVLVLLLVVGAICFCARFTNNFTSGFSTFYVEYNDKTITADKSGYQLAKGKENRFGVGYSLAAFNDEKLSYSVKVMPNAENDFEFTVGEETHKFTDIGDLSAHFNITRGEDYFVLVCNETLDEIIKGVYGDFTYNQEVSGDKDYFNLVISSEDGSKTINLKFNVTVKAEEIKPNVDNIVSG